MAYPAAMPMMSSSRPIDGFESSRHFQMWRYDVGHAQLLLRSVKDDFNASRIDVLFKDVETIDLPTSLVGLRLRQEDDGFSSRGRTGWAESGRALASQKRMRANTSTPAPSPSPSRAPDRRRPHMPLWTDSIHPAVCLRVRDLAQDAQIDLVFVGTGLVVHGAQGRVIFEKRRQAL